MSIVRQVIEYARVVLIALLAIRWLEMKGLGIGPGVGASPNFSPRLLSSDWACNARLEGCAQRAAEQGRGGAHWGRQCF